MSARRFRLTITRPGHDELEEVRLRDIDDPAVTHLWGYRWVPGPTETIDLSDYVTSFQIRHDDGGAS